MRIQFDYDWYNAEKTVIRYRARDNWTWKDFHAAVHVSQYAVMGQPHTVHTLIDFSTGARERFPSGFAAHAHAFSKKHTENMSGRAVVIGVPVAVLAKLGIGETRVLTTTHGTVQFVDTEAEAQAALAALD